jgi:hypothetical protein
MKYSPNKNKEEDRLHKSQLASVQGTAALGLVVAKRLIEAGVCSIYLSNEGFVEVALTGEVTLDALPEPMAIQELVKRGYSDDQLCGYLSGRDARMGRG